MTASNVPADEPAPLTSRQREILDAARELLAREGADAVTMGAIARALGIKPPSLYKHFADRTAIETLLVAEGFAALARELAEVPQTLEGFAGVYRATARAQPHLYRLMTDRPLARERLPEGLEARAQAPLLAATGGDQDLARAVWGFAHGMVVLELAGRFPPGADLERAWTLALEAFGERAAR